MNNAVWTVTVLVSDTDIKRLQPNAVEQDIDLLDYILSMEIADLPM